MNLTDVRMIQSRLDFQRSIDRNSVQAQTDASQSGSTTPSALFDLSPAHSAVAMPGAILSRILTGLTQSTLGTINPTVHHAPDTTVQDRARSAMVRTLITASQGKNVNVGLALQRYTASQTGAIEEVQRKLTHLQRGNASAPAQKKTSLGACDVTNANSGDTHSNTPTLGSSAPSASSDPDTSTPAKVDAITIETLADLKAYYAAYAADYTALSAFIETYAATQPDECKKRTQDFAAKYSAPIIISAGIDPAYAQTALGGTWSVSDITLPGKGNFQAYRVNLGVVQDYLDDMAFCARLNADEQLAGLIWNASAGEDTRGGSAAGPAPTYNQVKTALQALEASFNVRSHVSALPENVPDFYTVTPDPAGGYWVAPSQKYVKIISDCDAYLKEWADHYQGAPTDADAWDRTCTGATAAQQAYGDAGSWLAQSSDNDQWMKNIIAYSEQAFKDWTPDVTTFDADIDSLVRSDAAQYGGLKTTISEAKDAIIDPYGSLVDEYMNYTQSVTDVVAALSNYVKASSDGSKVTFQASDFKAKIDAEISQLKNWSLTVPGTAILSNTDWGKELSGNFVASKNQDGTTTLTLDLSNLQEMSNSLSSYGNADISVTQYNAWYAGFTSQKDNVQNLSQSIAEKFSKMNTTFDDLVRVMSATISALLESEAKYFQF